MAGNDSFLYIVAFQCQMPHSRWLVSLPYQKSQIPEGPTMGRTAAVNRPDGAASDDTKVRTR